MNARLLSRRLSLGLIIAFCVIAAPVSAYVPLTVSFSNGDAVIAHWRDSAFPVSVVASEGLSPDIGGDADVEALQSALRSWSSVDGSNARLRYGGEGDVQAGVIDGINAIEFSTSPGLGMSGAITQSFLLIDDDGVIREADILVNNRAYTFNTDGGNVGLDLETALLRELGHLLGLDSSPVGEMTFEGGQQMVDDESAVMFPVPRGPTQTARTLTHDDMAAVAAVYPSGGGRGSISGRITQSGNPVFGAHVVVFEPVDQVLVGAVTLPDGTYTAGGLPPGRYVIRVEALKPPADASSLGGIYSTMSDLVNSSFRPAFLERYVDVVAGSEAGGVNLEVQ
jgi:hypothetical protein